MWSSEYFLKNKQTQQQQHESVKNAVDSGESDSLQQSILSLYNVRCAADCFVLFFKSNFPWIWNVFQSVQ